MYIPPKLLLDESQTRELIRREPFAVLVSAAQVLCASHLPLVLSRCGTKLYGHMARANPQWKDLHGKSVLAIFSGPHAYISPNWYAQGPAVPTWNYTAAHVSGILSVLDGEAALNVLMESVKTFEPSLLTSERMPADYVDKLSSAIVAFEIAIEKIEGKAKLGQHRKIGDQQGVSAALDASDNRQGKALLQEMHRLELGLGNEENGQS